MNDLNWATCWAIARRELHAGIRGLRLLFICLFLGVTALAAIGSLTHAITDELAEKGQVLLGGDVEVAMTQREASAAEKAALRDVGRLSETIRTRAMARRVGKPADSDRPAVLTELKGVDRAYPLYGDLRLGKTGYSRRLAPDQLLIDPALAARLQVGRGGHVRYGAADFTIADIIAEEPDRVSEGFTLGPVALVSIEGLRRTGLIQPGSLYESKYRIALRAGQDAHAVREALEKRFASAGWEYKDRDGAAPGAQRFFERMGQFLSLIGLAALLIAGIGVSNGVGSYLALKRGPIATLKILGAASADIERIYLLQVGAIAAAAIGCGLMAGALLAPALVLFAGDMLPGVRPGIRLYPAPLATSAAYGLLVGLLFTLPPLARARQLPAAALFRGAIEQRRIFDRRTVLLTGSIGIALIGLVLGTAREPVFSAAVLAATAAVVLLLLGLGALVSRAARHVPRPRHPTWRLAVANLYRPGAQTSALIVALGLALTLFVTLAGIQTSLEAEIGRTVPKKAPNQFVLDIPASEAGRFRDVVLGEAPGARLNVVPTLRGTIVAYGGQRVADLKALPKDAWFLRGERGVTYSAALPQGSDLVSGRWWPANYQGPPLVSLDEKAAKTLGIGVGDMLTVSVLGREIEARIGSLRKVHWDTMGFNYILVFSPHALEGAPHSLAATITMPPARDDAVSRALLRSFPGISVIAVGELIGKVSGLLRQMSAAIVAAASVAIFAGIAVLISAIAASRQARSYDSVIFKTLGATRLQVLAAQAVEYGLLAAVVSLLSLALGSAAAWYVIVQLFDFTWAPDWPVVLLTLMCGASLTLGIGVIGSLPLMSVRPARALRQL